jgi:hypothetical protein
MAEDLHLAHLSISDREDLKEVDHDRDAAFPAAAALADGSQDPIPWRLDELKRLRGEVDPRPSILLAELMEFRGASKILWRVGVRLLVTPVGLDLRIEDFRKNFPGEFTAHERVEVVESRAHDLDVLLRHRPRSISPSTAAFHAKQRRFSSNAIRAVTPAAGGFEAHAWPMAVSTTCPAQNLRTR